jgi:C4-dicarboxylate-specific signal transduction histidine kinase
MSLNKRIGIMVWTVMFATSITLTLSEQLGLIQHGLAHVLIPLAAGLIIMMWIDRQILRRVQELSNNLERIASEEKLTAAERLLPSDEIDHVAGTVDALIQKTQARLLSLRKRKAYIRAILDAIPGHVSWIKRDLTYRGVNASLAKASGLAADDFAGRPVGFQNQGSESQFRRTVENFFASDAKSVQLEIEAKDTQGNMAIWYVTGQKYAEGNEAVFVGIDISGMRKLELEITKQKEKNANAARMAALGEMAGGVAHEINNPLAIITNKSYVIRKLSATGSLTHDKLTTELEVIERTARRISKIVTGMRRFARDGKGDPFQKYSVQQIIMDTVDMCQARIKASGVQMILPVSSEFHSSRNEDHQNGEALNRYGNDLLIDCRPMQICQVLLNLISNSWHAVKDLEKGWIRVEYETKGNLVELRVTDSGTGIPSEMREKLFAPFFTTKDPDRGTGLGLSISHGIVKDHGGEILLDTSATNTTFVVRLPVRQLLSATENEEPTITQPLNVA